MTEPKMVKTSFKIREDLFLKAKLLAEARETTFTDILNKSLEEYLKVHEEEIKKRVDIIQKLLK